MGVEIGVFSRGAVVGGGGREVFPQVYYGRLGAVGDVGLSAVSLAREPSF
jgi:hypothetical protein